MKDLSDLNKFRVAHPLFGLEGDDRNGCFYIPGPCGMKLQIIASCDAGWDHVSVSLKNRPPNWAEMSFVKVKFFEPEETAYQLHVAESEHINLHPNCLHLWRPHDKEIPLPPRGFV